jgi:hypothetical protein
MPTEELKPGWIWLPLEGGKWFRAGEPRGEPRDRGRSLGEGPHFVPDKPCSCPSSDAGCVIKGKGISAPEGRYCIAGWEGWRY